MKTLQKQRFGVHVSIAGGLHEGLKRAVEIGCDTAQIFLVNPRSWASTPLTDEAVERFFEVRNGLAKDVHPLVAHMPYLPNLAAEKEDVWRRSIESLLDNLKRCDRLQIDYLVIHMGKTRSGDGIQRMSEALRRAYDGEEFATTLLFENTAGQGNEMGHTIPLFAECYERFPQDISKGVCLDTCHAFASGTDWRDQAATDAFFADFKKYIGLKELKVVHLNDSMKKLGSRVDRHAKIGEGEIGQEGFRRIFTAKPFAKMPFILETPRETQEDDIYNLQTAKRIATEAPK